MHEQLATSIRQMLLMNQDAAMPISMLGEVEAVAENASEFEMEGTDGVTYVCSVLVKDS